MVPPKNVMKAFFLWLKAFFVALGLGTRGSNKSDTWRICWKIFNLQDYKLPNLFILKAINKNVLNVHSQDITAASFFSGIPEILFLVSHTKDAAIFPKHLKHFLCQKDIGDISVYVVCVFYCVCLQSAKWSRYFKWFANEWQKFWHPSNFGQRA